MFPSLRSHIAARSLTRARQTAVLVAIVSLFQAGCGREPQAGPWRVHTDLLQLGAVAEVQTETGRIEFAAAEAGRHLGGGWGRYEEVPSIGSVVWATAKHAAVRLVSLDGGPAELAFRCVPARASEAQPLDLSLRINRRRLQRIPLEPIWRDYKVEVPEGFLSAGVNLLTFEFAELRRPRNPDGERADARSLAAQFDYLELRTAARAEAASPQPLQPSKNGWIQRGPSRLNVYLELPAGARLSGRAAASSDLELLATVQPELESSVSVLDRRLRGGGTEPITADLSRFAGKLVRLSLQTGAAAALRWSKLAIETPEAAAPTAAPARTEAPALPRLGRRSSVIVIVFDAAAAAHFGCYGYPRPTTPNVDAIAAAPEAVVFEHAYANAPYTLASTGSLFTGLYPERHGVVDQDLMLAPEATTWAELMQANGFTTAGFSMNAFASEKFGYDQGFDFFLKKHKFFFRVPQYLESGPRAPLFLYLHYINPHAPYQPKYRFRRRFVDPAYRGPIDGSLPQLNQLFKRLPLPAADLRHVIDLYDADLASVDAELAIVLQALKRHQLYDEALLILTSDHGEAFFEHGRRGHNTTVYDEMVRIPLVMKFPKGVRPRQRRIAAPVQSVDLMPTVLELIGVQPPPSLDGGSLLPLVFGAEPPARPVVTRAEQGLQYALRLGRYKLILHQGPPGIELFDLQTDPAEKRDLSASNSVRAGFLGQRLRELRSAWAGPATATQHQIDDETRAELRALGYL